MLRVRHAMAAGAAVATFVLMSAPASAALKLPPAGLRPHTILPAACALDLRAGFSHCQAKLLGTPSRKPVANAAPAGGYGPNDLQSAYALPSGTAGAGQTVAIVDAYDDTSAEADMGTYRSQYGLPACTTANGCFTKVNQSGGTSYPRADPGWALEISLDVQWAHAIAPGAKILLVEASSNSFTNLLAAEDYAAAHAQYVSNSWGGSEFSGESSYDSHFAHSGVSFFVSAGDAGLPAEYPSASPNVISVGGTTLHFSGSTFTGETGWSSGGGGCSTYEGANGAQSAFSQYGQANCGGKRATPDVSLDADPSSGVSVYDSVSYNGQTGWFTVGGTSASSPMWAARSADQGVVDNSAYVYGSSITYRDITSGNNGAPCLVGFDLCTGRGSWTGGGSTTIEPSLTISGGGQALTAGVASAPMTVTISAVPSSDLVVNLGTSSTTGTFTPSSVTIPAGQLSSSPFTYTDTSPGTWTLTATAAGATGGTTTVTVNPSTLSTMSVAVTAGAVSKKGPNYHVPVTVTATDATSAGINGASVSFAVYSGSCSGALVASGSGTTGSNGQVGFTFSTRQSGTWCAAATVSAAGYSTNSGTDTFATP